RWPGRPGGLRKCRPLADWRRRCQHLVSPPLIPEPHHPGFLFCGSWDRRKDRRPEHLAYLVDQETSRLGIPYFMTLVTLTYWRAFVVVVSEAHAEQVERFISRVEGRKPVALPPRAPAPDAAGDSAGPASTELS